MPARPTLRRSLLRAALAALAVVAFCTVADVFFLPLHRRGVAQGILGGFNAMSRTVQIPALIAVHLGEPWRFGRKFNFTSWAVHSGFTFVFYSAFYLALGAVNRLAGRFARRLLHRRAAPVTPTAPAAIDPSSSPVPSPQLSRRRFLLSTKSAIVAGGTAVALGYPVIWEPGHFRITRRTFPVPGLPPALDRLRIVQLTDIHLGPWSSEAYVRKVVASANALDADLIALTGDYVLHSPAYITPAARILAALRAKIGIVGVLGNHDWREGGVAMRQALAATGVRMIDNDRIYLTAARRLSTDAPGNGLCLAGVGDLWTDAQFYDQALEGVPKDMPRILLSHNPDVAEEKDFVTSGYRVDLMLSGHTHGGQVYIPGLGTPVLPSKYGQKYASGLVKGPTCPVFISCGLGTALLPMRIGVPPEIAVIELKMSRSSV
jgi:predicted MPP superfamily phosphohydrolase